MSRFAAPRVRFGTQPQATDVPTPTLTKAAARRTAMLAEASDILDVLPAEGEALHAILTGRFDLMHVIVALVEQLGAIEAMKIATLSFNGRNLTEMVKLLDAGKVKTLTLLCSRFFAAHNEALWETTLAEFRTRGQKAAAARSHCKVITLATASGERYVLEGSANLRTNSNREQLAIIRDAGLHDWHATWIDDLVSAHEGEDAPRD